MGQATSIARIRKADAFSESPDSERDFFLVITLLVFGVLTQVGVFATLGYDGWWLSALVFGSEALIVFFLTGHLNGVQRDRNTALDQCLQLASEVGIDLSVSEVAMLAKAGSAGQTYLHFVQNTLANDLPLTYQRFFVGKNQVDQSGSRGFIEYLHEHPEYYLVELREVPKQPVESQDAPEQTGESAGS